MDENPTQAWQTRPDQSTAINPAFDTRADGPLHCTVLDKAERVDTITSLCNCTVQYRRTEPWYVTLFGDWLGGRPSLPSLVTGGGSPVVDIDAPASQR